MPGSNLPCQSFRFPAHTSDTDRNPSSNGTRVYRKSRIPLAHLALFANRCKRREKNYRTHRVVVRPVGGLHEESSTVGLRDAYWHVSVPLFEDSNQVIDVHDCTSSPANGTFSSVASSIFSVCETWNTVVVHGPTERRLLTCLLFCFLVFADNESHTLDAMLALAHLAA